MSVRRRDSSRNNKRSGEREEERENGGGDYLLALLIPSRVLSQGWMAHRQAVVDKSPTYCSDGRTAPLSSLDCL